MERVERPSCADPFGTRRRDSGREDWADLGEEGAEEGEEEDGDGDDRLFNRHVFESITHTVVEMQKSMRSMNLDMERTHEAMRGVTHRLKVQGQIVHALHRSMNVLEKRACLFGPPSATATAATASAGAATAVTNAPPGTAPAAYTVR
ncbi:Protein of unknown function [Gryllus bimaculatus]|nr:Protein of unknown function [Gryllus bimaculatus]